MLMNHHDLFGQQSPVKVQSCILVRPNKGPPSPLSHMAIRSTNTWVGMTHFTDDLCTVHLNFRIIKWNNLRLAKMPIRLLFKNPSLFGKNFKASRLITNYVSEISRSDQNFVRPRSGHIQMTYNEVMLRIKVFICLPIAIIVPNKKKYCVHWSFVFFSCYRNTLWMTYAMKSLTDGKTQEQRCFNKESKLKVVCCM